MIFGPGRLSSPPRGVASSMSPTSSRPSSSVLLAWFASVSLLLGVASPVLGGGHPDPGNQALSTTNENQLTGYLGPDRGFGSGDYVVNGDAGLQGQLGPEATYDFYIEVPPGQAQLVVELFDADLGAGAVGGGTELHDQNNTTIGWDATPTYELVDPSGVLFATITLPSQDCDPVSPGLQTACDNAWSDLGTFSVANPEPGHWRFRVTSIDDPVDNDEDDNNSYGLRAHDGDATGGGTEYNVYNRTYAALGQVYADSFAADPGLSRTHDLYPYVLNSCFIDSNDFDSDSPDLTGTIDESLDFMTRMGDAPSVTPSGVGSLSGDGLWVNASVGDFTSSTDATDYGLWSARWVTGRFNFITWWMGDPSAADPNNNNPGPGNGTEPNQQPEPGSIRLYLPADGSTFFGQSGGPNDAVIKPTKPWVGQSWALLPGEPPVQAGVVSRVEITITVENPTDFPIQFGAATSDANVIQTQVPNNSGETEYVSGSAQISGDASSSAVLVTGTGPWNVTYAPGVVPANGTATLTYQVDVMPEPGGSIPRTLLLTGVGSFGTRGSFIDESCADAAGGASSCTAVALDTATLDIGPLCPLSVDVTSSVSIGLAKELATPPVDNGDGTFSLQFDFVVENLGDETLNNVQVTDDLTSVFFGADSLVIDGLTAMVASGTGTIAPNGSYDGGQTDATLLAPGGSLDANSTASITLDVTVDPGSNGGPFLNFSEVTAQTLSGASLSDFSDDGTDPDPDGDENANEDAGPFVCPSDDPADGCENDPTPVDFPFVSRIGLAKDVADITDNGDGTFDVDLSLVVENFGNSTLTGVRVTDDLASQLGPDATFTVGPVVVVAPPSSTLTANPGFDGDTDTQTLQPGTGSLQPGDAATITFTVTIDPNLGTCSFTNAATAGGTGPGGFGESTTDTSDDGPDPDPNGNGDPGDAGENDPTPIVLPADSVIGAAKEVTSTVNNGDGSYTVSFSLVVENFGNVDLQQVQLVDDLLAAFPAPATIDSVTTPVATGTLVANGGYNGTTDMNLLVAGASNLVVGASETVTFTVTFSPNDSTTTFTNQAQASGTGCDGTAVDLSDEGTDPDEDGDDMPDEDMGACPSSDPAEDCEDDETVIDVAEAPSIQIAKTASAVTDVPGLPGSFDVTFTFVVENLGDVDLDMLQVTDDLSATFPDATVSSASASCTAGACGQVTIDYTGPTDTTLLDETASGLTVGSGVTLELDVRFQPDGTSDGSFTNTAISSATSPAGTMVSDTDSATFQAIAAPGLVTTKTVSNGPISNGDGTFTVEFTIDLENTGNVFLSDLSAVDSLSSTFPAPATILVVTPPTATGTLTANPAYNGQGVDELLVPASSTLAPGVSSSVTVSVTFAPNDTGTIDYDNTVVATGTSPTGQDVTDTDTTTVTITFTMTGVLGVAKDLVSLDENGDGTFTASFLFAVENLGQTTITNLQVVDDLAAAFPAPASVIAVTPPVAMITIGTGTLVANPAYDGIVDTELLVAGGSSLDPGSRGEIAITVTFDPGGLTEFENQAFGSGDDGGGGTTDDPSDDGDDVDNDDDGVANEDGDNDVTIVTVGEDEPVIEIPTLGTVGTIGLVLLLSLFGAARIRRGGLA